MRRRRAALLAGGLALVVAPWWAGPPAAAIPPDIEISPSAVDFGVVNQGQASAPRDVVVTNTSGRAIGPVAIAGAVAPPEAQAEVFLLDDGCAGTTLPPGASCVLRYTFRPFFVGTSAADLDVQVLEQGQPVGAVFPVALSGVGVNPLVVRPAAVDFGAVPVGVTATARLQVRNPSDQPFGPLDLARSDALDPPFAVDLDPCWGAVLPPGGSCEVTVGFRPDGPGPASVAAALGISATAGRASVSFPYELRGCGATPASACSAEVPPPSAPSTSTTSTSTSTSTTTAPTSPPVDTTAPPTSSSVPIAPAPAGEPPRAAAGGAALPRTGSDPAPLVAGGIAAVLAGVGLVGLARRRRVRPAG